MTLIAGTIGWKGVCIGTDTRATHTYGNKQADYTDDLQKIDMLPQGLGIAVAGNCHTATVFRELLIKNLTSNRKYSNSFYGPTQILRRVIKKSLRDLAFDDRVYSKPIEDTYISGLIIGVDLGIPLRLNRSECRRIIDVKKMALKTNKVWDKYEDDIKRCANNQVKQVDLDEFPHSMLFSFKSRLGSGNSKGILQVRRVPFGNICALGSGKSRIHSVTQKKTLGFLLFEVEPEFIDDSAFHILRTHGLSELFVPPDPKLGFRTFGGGYLYGVFIKAEDNPRNVVFRVSMGNIFRKPNSDLICTVYEDNNHKLCVRTSEGKDWVLKKFWEYKNSANISMSG